MWIVVHFIKDNSVEVVPQTWILNKSNGEKDCLWPPFSNKMKLFDCVKSRQSPDCNWKAYSIKILGHYDNLEVAQQKCNKARDTDDLSSTSEFLENKSNFEKIRRIRKQKEHGDYLYDFDPDKPQFPKSFLSKKQLSQNNSGSSDSEQEYIRAERPKVLKNISHSKHSTLEGSHSSQHSFMKETDNQTETIEHLTLEVNETKQFYKNVQDFIEKSCEFQRQVIKEIFMIKCIVKENREVMNLLIKRQVTIDDTENNENNKNLIHEHMKKFPLRFSEDLLDIEEQLENDMFLNAMAKEMALVGGESVKDITIKLLYHIMSNKLASLYSWEGQKGKKVFKSLKLATLVIKAVRVRHPMATENDIIARIKNWLGQAKFRENLKIKRNEQRASTPDK